MDQIRLAGRETGWVVGDQVPHERLLFFLRGVLQVGGGAKSRGFGAIGLSFAGCHGCQSHCAHVVRPATGMRGIQLPTRLDYGASVALLRRVSLSHSVLNIAECYSRSRFRKFVANAIRSFASAEVNKASLGRATGSRRESHHEASRPKALRAGSEAPRVTIACRLHLPIAGRSCIGDFDSAKHPGSSKMQRG